jgi:hypothetical protein
MTQKSYVVVGNQYTSNNFGEYTVIEMVGSNKNRRHLFKVRFDSTGYEAVVTSKEIINGRIKDYFYPGVCGIGYLERPKKDFTNKSIYSKLYSVWDCMLGRCYNLGDIGYSNYGGRGVTVDSRWLSFWNFYQDAQNLAGWDESLFMGGALQLDKDKLQQDSSMKSYSCQTCLWLGRSENAGFTRSMYAKTILATSPLGDEYTFNNINSFAKEHNLTAPNVICCLKGRAEKHKGWYFEYIGERNEG